MTDPFEEQLIFYDFPQSMNKSNEVGILMQLLDFTDKVQEMRLKGCPTSMSSEFYK